MKNLQLFTVLFLTILLPVCNTTDNNPISPNGSPGSDDVMNGDGLHDGVWLLVYEHEYGYNDYKFNEVPEKNFYDIDSGIEEFSDTSFLMSLSKNSASLYMFDPEENADTFIIEYLTLELLNEYAPDNFEESDKETLKSTLKDRFMFDSIGEISNFTIESIDDIASLNDTLIITFGFYVSADFTVFENNKMVFGSYESEMACVYKLVKYSGLLPPDSWPKDYVEEFSDEENDDHNDHDDDEIEINPLNSWRLILLPNMSPTIQETTEIALTIYEEFSSTSSTGVDTTYVLLANHITSTSTTGYVLLYESYGSASVTDGNVIITGIFCKLLNTTTQKMESLSSDICGKPISLPTTGLSEHEWIIPGEVMTSFPFFTEEQKSALSNINFNFSSPNYDDM